jgi:hypothetical protein
MRFEFRSTLRTQAAAEADCKTAGGYLVTYYTGAPLPLPLQLVVLALAPLRQSCWSRCATAPAGWPERRHQLAAAGVARSPAPRTGDEQAAVDTWLEANVSLVSFNK